MIKKFRLYKIKFKRFFKYFGFYFPELNRCFDKRQHISNLHSQSFRANNKEKISYYQGQLDLIDSLVESWYHIKHEGN